jgi:predicted ATP-grasp superfamily ATP-dependent carboligase
MKILITHAVSGPVLAMIRELANAGYTVVGVDEKKVPFGLYSRHARLIRLDANNNKEGYLGALLDVIRREKPDLLVPYTDVQAISENKDRFEKYTRVLAPDYRTLMKAHDKNSTLEECGRLGIDCPAVYSEEEALERLSGNGRNGASGKLVVKPAWNAGGGQGFTLVSDPRALTDAKNAVEREFGEAMIQDYIPGGADAMRSAGLLFGKGGRLAAYFTLKKLRLYPRIGGMAALAVSTNEENLVKTVLPLFNKWEWEGPAEVEFKMDPRDGQPKLLEVNPRFWGTVGFPIRCGVNFPVLACRLAMGGDGSSFPIPRYPAGVKYINPSFYLYSTFDELVSDKHKLRILRSAISDLKGKKVGNHMGFSDPLMMAGKLLLDFKSILFGDD